MHGERAVNPYESVDAPDLAALTAHEQRMLKFYLKYRTTCPTLVSLVIRYLPSWGMMGCTFAILLGVVFLMSGAVLTVTILVFVTGVWFGAILRDFGQCRRVARFWPLHQRILNWSVVENFLFVSSPSQRLE